MDLVVAVTVVTVVRAGTIRSNSPFRKFDYIYAGPQQLRAGILFKTTMKKIIIITAAVAAVLASCGSQTVEQKQEAFKAEVEKFMTAYSDSISAIMDDASLSEEQKNEKAQAYSEEAEPAFKKLCLNTISKNSTNAVALDALQEVYYLLDLDELDSVLKSLGDSLQTDDFVQSLTKQLAGKKATAEGQMFTDFTVVQDPDNAESSTVKLSDYVGKGKYILVDFWASWCGPCKAEIPNIASVYKKYAGDDFDILSIAVWDKPEDTAKAAREEGIEWNQIVNAQKEPCELYGIEGIPHIILFGPDGTILKRDLRGKSIEEEVSKYVQAK